MTTRRTFAALALLIALGANAPPGAAIEPGEALGDPALEERARDIGKMLRCLVCQNQSIDDSDAELARDLRAVVRERLAAGDSDDRVIAFVAVRYGDFVLLEPPFKPATYLLWLGPALALGAGVAAMFLFLQRRPGIAGTTALTDEEERRLARLTGEDAGS